MRKIANDRYQPRQHKRFPFSSLALIVLVLMLVDMCKPIGAHELGNQSGLTTRPITFVPSGINLVFGLDPGKGNYDGVIGRPDDTWNFVDVGTTKLDNLSFSDGSKTGSSFEITPHDGEWGITGHTGVFHAYIYDNSRSVDLTAKFHNLRPGRYRVLVYAHGDAANQNAKVKVAIDGRLLESKSTLNDGTDNYRNPELVEDNQYVMFEFDLGKDSSLEITSLRDGSEYSMFNAIQILPVMN